MVSGTIAIIKLGLFYYDVLKDISHISMLNQVEFTLLEDVEGTTEYDFGGLNFKVTKYHLVIVLIISEMLRNGYMQIYWIDWTKMGEDCSSFIHFDESFEIKSRLYGDESPEYAEKLMNKWKSV